jgi:N-acetyl-1-D-myo-inositol-2-amino-2-deoxy-alpha-D-glucopyranoside deacetylase
LGEKKKLQEFPVIDSNTRLLVVSPHPDDEILIGCGIIQRVVSERGQVKIVFLTNGDASDGTVMYEHKYPNLYSENFLKIGIKRMEEALKVGLLLGLDGESLIFLGFPDRGLKRTLNDYYSPETSGFYSSIRTKVNYVPYDGAYKVHQPYSGENLYTDLTEIVKDFSPNMVITTHQNDTHKDHKVAAILMERLKKEFDFKWLLLTSVVHFPRNLKVKNDGKFFLPKKFEGSEWVVFNLNKTEIDKKRNLIKLYKSQYRKLADRLLFRRFLSNHEVFEIDG